jgi:ABC-type spermidine/putrescine transport system permease subunit II
MGLSQIKKVSGVVMAIFALVGGLALASSLWTGWHSGTLFERYRNSDYQWTSHGEAMVVGVIVILVLVTMGLWSWRGRRREQRLLRKMATRGRAG